MLIGYRCKVCGAPVDPESGYCKYCNTLNFKPILDKPLEDIKPQIIVRHDGKEATINPLSLSIAMEQTDYVEVTTLESNYRRFIPSLGHMQYARFEIKTQVDREVTEILRQPKFEAVFTGFRRGYGHSFEAYAENPYVSFSQTYTSPTMSFDIVSYHPVDLWNERKIIPSLLIDARCPICGADLDPEKPKCDYCGYYWVLLPEGR